MVAVVLDSQPPLRVGEVEPGHEPPVHTVYLVLHDRHGQPGIDDQPAAGSRHISHCGGPALAVNSLRTTKPSRW